MRDWIGDGLKVLVERMLAAHGICEPEQIRNACERFEAAYGFCCHERSRVFPGVVQTLRRLRTSGYRLACVTNKPSRFAHRILVGTGIASFFERVVGGDEVAFRKPAPESLLLASRQLGVAPEACAVIGDSRHDIDAARRASMPVACVSCGYHRGDDLGSLLAGSGTPGRLIDQFADIWPLLESGWPLTP